MLMAEKSLDKEFDCEKCLRKNLDRARNCSGEEENPKWIPILRPVPWMRLKQCPRQLITEEAIELWEQYEIFELTGALPYPGGSNSQPAIWIEVIRFCKNLMNKIQHDRSYTKWYGKKKRQEEDDEGKIQGNIRNFGDVAKKRSSRRSVRRK